MKVGFRNPGFLKRVDAHFGWAKNIAVYEATPRAIRSEAFVFAGDLQEDGNEDKLQPKLDAIKDCAIYVAAIGGSGAARAVAQNIHPMNNQPEEISDLLDKLRAFSKGSPPPWLRKVMGTQSNR